VLDVVMFHAHLPTPAEFWFRAASVEVLEYSMTNKVTLVALHKGLAFVWRHMEEKGMLLKHHDTSELPRPTWQGSTSTLLEGMVDGVPQQVRCGSDVLVVPNHHRTPATQVLRHVDGQISYFVNAHGEQWIFSRSPGADHAFLAGGDMDWEPREIPLRGSCGVVLDAAEQAWVDACRDVALEVSGL